MKKCALIGCGPNRLPFGESDERGIRLKEAMKEQLIKLIEDGVSCFLTGLSMGAEMYAAEILLGLKPRYPDIMLECVIPYEEQAARWPEAVRERYFTIASKCDKETMLQTHYTSGCIQKEVRYRIDEADAVLAVWDGNRGAVGTAVKYASSRGKRIIQIDPLDAVKYHNKSDYRGNTGPSADSFYSERNIRYLEEKMEDYKNGKLDFSEHEIIED